MKQAQVGVRLVTLILFVVMISLIQEHISKSFAVPILFIQCRAFPINIALSRVAPLLRFMSKLSTDHQIAIRQIKSVRNDPVPTSY